MTFEEIVTPESAWRRRSRAGVMGRWFYHSGMPGPAELMQRCADVFNAHLADLERREGGA